MDITELPAHALSHLIRRRKLSCLELVQGPAKDAWVAQIGTERPMGRSVRDIALLLEVQSRHDPRVPLPLAGGERIAQAAQELLRIRPPAAANPVPGP